MESVRYGIYGENRDIAGKTVAQLRQEIESAWGLPSDAVAYCGNTPLADSWIIAKGAIIQFHRPQPDMMVPCIECGIVVRLDGADTYIYVLPDPVMYYCGSCWRHMHSPENRDEVIAELIEILASAALPFAAADEPVVAADPT